MRLLGWWSVEGCGVVWNSTSQVNPRERRRRQGEGGLCGRRRRGDGDGDGQRTELERGCRGARVSRSLVALARPCSCPSLSPKESRTTGRRVPFQRKRDRSVETERGRAFAPAGWDWDWDSGRARLALLLTVVATACHRLFLPAVTGLVPLTFIFVLA